MIRGPTIYMFAGLAALGCASEAFAGSNLQLGSSPSLQSPKMVTAPTRPSISPVTAYSPAITPTAIKPIQVNPILMTPITGNTALSPSISPVGTRIPAGTPSITPIAQPAGISGIGNSPSTGAGEEDEPQKPAYVAPLQMLPVDGQ